MPSTNWRGYRTAAWIGQALLAVGIIVVVMQRNWSGVAALSGFLVASFLFVKLEDRLPTLFDLLFIVAALLNAGGWAFDWYNQIYPYDEIAHGFTTFALTLALGYVVYNELMQSFSDHPWLFVLTIASFGIAIGALWEIVEWTADFFVAKQIVKSLNDTIVDLVMDSIGAIAAGWLSLTALHERSRIADQTRE